MENVLSDVNKPSSQEVLNVKGFDKDFLSLIKAISSLTNKILNHPTTKEKVFPANFVIDKNNLSDLFQTIETKIRDYKSDEKSFEISVLYNDGSYTKFPSFDEFLNDNEVKPICAKNISLSWEMKIFFEGRNPLISKIGEQHSINVTISVPPENFSDKAFYMFNGYPVDSNGIIQVSVNHSNKVFADEIIQHVSDYVDRISGTSKNNENFFKKNRRRLGMLIEILLKISAIIPITFIFFNTNDYNYIIKLFSISFMLFLFTQIFAEFIGKSLFNLLGKSNNTSWIILNDYTKKKFDENKSKSHLGITFFVYLLLPLIINIFAAWLCNKLGL